ncbi:MAG: hypothetical protein KGK11_06915, partial [Sphingomonadales bacterium]|nr:hypothetical protein [Sphingomonadales bacterium]
ALLLLLAACGPAGAGRAAPQRVEAPAQAIPPPPAADTAPAAVRDRAYPFYMPMAGLRRPAIRLTIKCDASRAAGHEVYQGRDAASLYGRAEGGYEFVFEARDGAGHPCVYPFAPWQPALAGNLDGTQYLWRSSEPGVQVTFRSNDPWAGIDFRPLDIGGARIHFEMRDIALDFPGAVQAMGALHLEAFGGEGPGLFTAVLRRVALFGGKNALFVPGGQTMLYIEDSAINGNVGNETDQDHGTYINGILVTHIVDSRWHGQRGWADQASGHQLKDKAYLRIYENVAVSNAPGTTVPSAMPLIDASEYGFTFANGLTLSRERPVQAPRDALVDLRGDMLYPPRALFPWNPLADGGWRMPAQPLDALGRVYVSVFLNTRVASFRREPYVFALRPAGRSFDPDGSRVLGTEATTRGEQRAVSLAFDTTGSLAAPYAPGGWTYVDPRLPAGAQWVLDRDAFIRHALGLIGR